MTQFFLTTTPNVLFSIGTYLVLRRDVVRVVWGINIISQSVSVYLITMSGFDGLVPIPSGHGASGPTPSGPVVQALVLTTIVIGFGTTAFALVLTYRVYKEHGTIDMYGLGGDR